MSQHPETDLLAALALDEEVPAEVREHVRSCARCRQEAASLALAREVVRAPLPAVGPLPPGLRRRVLDAALEASDGGSAEEAPTAPVPPTPPDELGARRLARGSDPGPPARTGARRFGAAWLVAAAAAGVLVGGAGVAVIGREASQPAPTVVVARATLDTLDTGQARGTADLVRHDGTTDLELHTDPMSAGSGYLEVWLINRDLERMVSVGVLEPGTTSQTFTVPAALLDEGYVIVDVSREPYDAEARHSGDSLVRGTLA